MPSNLQVVSIGAARVPAGWLKAMDLSQNRKGNKITHLILGGNGFVGRHVALYLANLGVHVSIASRLPPTFDVPKSVAKLITWVKFDMAKANWSALLCGVDVLHHYAWSTVPASANADPSADLALNVASTVVLLEEMRRLPSPPRLVFTSSGGTVYGKLRQVPASETHELTPITAYGASKAAVEHYLGYYRAVYGLDCLVARLANPYGAGQNLNSGQGAASTFLFRALNWQPIAIWGDGNTVRDYIHVADVAAGLTALALSPRNMSGSWRFNIASGKGVSLNQIVAELERILGRRLVIHREPGRSFDVPVSVLDIGLARRELAWEPVLSFADGIVRTMRDLKMDNGFSTLDVGAHRLNVEQNKGLGGLSQTVLHTAPGQTNHIQKVIQI